MNIDNNSVYQTYERHVTLNFSDSYDRYINIAEKLHMQSVYDGTVI